MEDREQRKPGHLYFVTDAPPGPHSQFVELEDSDGKSVSLGEWVRLGDFYALEFKDPRPLHEQSDDPFALTAEEIDALKRNKKITAI